jgi:hypothetical protein
LVNESYGVILARRFEPEDDRHQIATGVFMF